MYKYLRSIISFFMVFSLAFILFSEANAHVHRVVPGDTLYYIAQNYGVSFQDLMEKNSYLRYPSFIQPGQVIIIPVEKKEYEKYPEIPEKEPQFPTISQLARMYSDRFHLQGTSNSAKVALTFDDGPDSVYTPQVLDLLNEYNITATFFLVGENIKKYPHITRRIALEGHSIGNHTWSHQNLSTLEKYNLINEVTQTENLLKYITGQEISLIRPPFGAVNESVLSQLIEMDYYIVNWSVDSNDWKEQNLDNILKNTLTGVKESSIILMHDSGGYRQATVNALPELIETLQMQGYTFVSVDKILNIPAYHN